jgi:hypothetical protein
MILLEDLLDKAAKGEGRIISTGDLTQLQIVEAQRTNNMFVDENGLGFVLLPWALTTDKDIQREKELAKRK